MSLIFMGSVFSQCLLKKEKERCANKCLKDICMMRGQYFWNEWLAECKCVIAVLLL